MADKTVIQEIKQALEDAETLFATHIANLADLAKVKADVEHENALAKSFLEKEKDAASKAFDAAKAKHDSVVTVAKEKYDEFVGKSNAKVVPFQEAVEATEAAMKKAQEEFQEKYGTGIKLFDQHTNSGGSTRL